MEKVYDKYIKEKDFQGAIQELKEEYATNPTQEVKTKLDDLIRVMKLDDTISQLLSDLQCEDHVKILEASNRLIAYSNTSKMIELESLRKLLTLSYKLTSQCQTNVLQSLNQLCRYPCNESNFIQLYSNENILHNLETMNEKSLFYFFDCISQLIIRCAQEEGFSIAKVKHLLDRMYGAILLYGSIQIQMAAIRAIMISMDNEQLALHFFKKENLYLCEKLTEQVEFKSLLVALLSRCFSKCSDTISAQVKSLLQTVISGFVLQNVINGVSILNAVFLANPLYGSPIFLQEGFLDSIMDALDVEAEPLQYHTVELFSSACAIPDCRKAISQYTGVLIPFYRQTKSLRLQLVALLTLVKLMPVSKDASQELLNNQDIITQITEIVQSGSKDFEVVALEGLVYLSIYPIFKEKMVINPRLVESLKGFFTSNDRASLYATCQIFSNISAYVNMLSEEEQQVRKLHQMAKSLPENDPLDDENAVTYRIDRLVDVGICSEIVKVKSDSINILSALSQIVCNIAINQKHRGKMVQCGILPFLVRLSNILMQHELIIPNHALAKILITSNPSMACKGQLANEVIRPLVILLVKGKHGLQQFEALMALTNLAGMDDDVRARILSFDILGTVENLQFSTNVLIKRASTELLCNLIYHPIVFSRYLDPKSGPGLQIVTALADDDDFPTRRAASGALAVLSSQIEGVPLLVQQSRFFEIALSLLQDKELELVHRGAELIKNIFCDSKTANMVPQNVLEAMKKLVKIPHTTIAECAKEGLLRAMKLGVRIG
jgi:DNA-binding transcriptional MerR regulator